MREKKTKNLLRKLKMQKKKLFKIQFTKRANLYKLRILIYNVQMSNVKTKKYFLFVGLNSNSHFFRMPRKITYNNICMYNEFEFERLIFHFKVFRLLLFKSI